MQIKQFQNLDPESQVGVAWKRGTHMGYRSDGKFYMSLYLVENFYVEVSYHTGFDGIAGVRTLTTDSELDPYLDQVDLDALLG